MKNVLLIQKPSALRDYIELILGTNEHINLAVSSSAAKALKYLQQKEGLDLIFIGHSFEQDLSGSELYTSIKEFAEKHSTKLIGTNTGIKKLASAKYLHYQAPTEKVLDVLKQTLEFKETELLADDFVALPVNLCLDFEKIPFDLHLKIGDGDSVKYIKRFKANEKVEHKAIEDYAAKNLTRIYILNKDLLRLNTLFKDELNREKLKDREEARGYFDTIKESLDYASFMLDDLGIEDVETKNVEDTYHMLEASIARNKGFFTNDYLIETLKSEEDFSTKLISLISLLGSNIIKNLKMLNEDEMVKNFVCAAYFQNLTLKGNKKLLACLTISDFEMLSKTEKEVVYEHARESSGILKKAFLFSSDVYTMILEQHGSEIGVGFPENKENSKTLSRLFRVVSDFCTKLLLEYEKLHEPVNIDIFIAAEKNQAKISDQQIYELIEKLYSKKI